MAVNSKFDARLKISELLLFLRHDGGGVGERNNRHTNEANHVRIVHGVLRLTNDGLAATHTVRCGYSPSSRPTDYNTIEPQVCRESSFAPLREMAADR